VRTARGPVPGHAAPDLAAVEGHARADVEGGIGSAVTGDDGCCPVLVVPQQTRGVGLEQLTDLDGDRLEQVGGLVAFGDAGGHAPQRSLLVNEHAGLLHVARGGVHQPALGQDPRRPIQPADLAVSRDVAVLEAIDRLAAAE
jgi:hypothetical protein